VASIVPAVLVNYHFSYRRISSRIHYPVLRLGECPLLPYQIILPTDNRKAKRRQWRAEDLVVPALKEARPLIQRQILHEMRVDQPRGTKEELNQMYSKRVQKAVRSTNSLKSQSPQIPTFFFFR
jgi:hypothetical protein